MKYVHVRQRNFSSLFRDVLVLQHYCFILITFNVMGLDPLFSLAENQMNDVHLD